MVISFVCVLPVRLLLSGVAVLYHVNTPKMERSQQSEFSHTTEDT